MTDEIRAQCLQRMSEWEATAEKAIMEGNATLAGLAKEHAAFFAARANPITLNYPMSDDYCPRCSHRFADQLQPCRNDPDCPHPAKRGV